MAINLKGVDTIENLMASALAAPDFGFLKDWKPTVGETYFPKINAYEDQSIDGEDRKKLAVVIHTLADFEKLLEDTDAELSVTRGDFSGSILTFQRDGELSVVAIPVTESIKRAMGGFLFAREMKNLPGGEKFIHELQTLLKSIPMAEGYLKWRWWPIKRDIRELNKRSAQQLLLTIRSPEDKNLLVLAEKMQAKANISNSVSEPTENDWRLAVSSLESLKELPKSSILATIDFSQVAQLKTSIAIIDRAYRKHDQLVEDSETSLKVLQKHRVAQHMNLLSLSEFSQKVKGSRFPRKALEDLFEYYAPSALKDDDQKCSVGSMLRLYAESPSLFHGISLRSGIDMLKIYYKDQDLTLSYPSLTDTDPLSMDFLKKSYLVYLDNSRAAYPPRAAFTTWEKIFRKNPNELRFIARSQKHLDQLLSSLEHYQDEKRIALLDEALPEVSPEQAQQFFKENPAVFQTILSTMGLNSLSLEQIAGFLAPELTKNIRAIEVDTSSMKAQLRSYQYFGVQYALHQRRIILGDEMGLGKTITALALASHLNQNGATRFLVILPLGVMENWRRETLKHSSFEPIVLYGDELEANLKLWENEGGFALTSFESLRKVNSLLHESKPADLVIVDEAHYIKNSETKRARAALPWILSTENLLLMTGTPLENNIDEFIQLIQYAQPQLPIPENRAAYTSFRRAIAPAYLRRNQIDVLTELPPKTDSEEYIELSPADVENYKRALKSRDWQLARRAKVLAGKNSSTVQRVQELVSDAMQNDNKVLIFSFYREAIDVLQQVLTDDDDYTPITGDLNSLQRQEVIDKFTAAKKPGVVLAQINSGGTGLNIQAATVVIIIEPQVKPSLEEQAIRRSFRMGQTKPVQIFRLRGKNTIDERWVKMLEEKRQLFSVTAGVSDAALLDNAVSGEQHALFEEELKAWNLEK